MRRWGGLEYEAGLAGDAVVGQGAGEDVARLREAAICGGRPGCRTCGGCGVSGAGRVAGGRCRPGRSARCRGYGRLLTCWASPAHRPARPPRRRPGPGLAGRGLARAGMRSTGIPSRTWTPTGTWTGRAWRPGPAGRGRGSWPGSGSPPGRGRGSWPGSGSPRGLGRGWCGRGWCVGAGAVGFGVAAGGQPVPLDQRGDLIAPRPGVGPQWVLSAADVAAARREAGPGGVVPPVAAGPSAEPPPLGMVIAGLLRAERTAWLALNRAARLEPRQDGWLEQVRHPLDAARVATDRALDDQSDNGWIDSRLLADLRAAIDFWRKHGHLEVPQRSSAKVEDKNSTLGGWLAQVRPARPQAKKQRKTMALAGRGSR